MTGKNVLGDFKIKIGVIGGIPIHHAIGGSQRSIKGAADAQKEKSNLRLKNGIPGMDHTRYRRVLIIISTSLKSNSSSISQDSSGSVSNSSGLSPIRVPCLARVSGAKR